MTAVADPPPPVPRGQGAAPAVVALDDPAARDAAVAGGRAAALARARRAGLPTLPGAVVTTVVSDRVDGGADPDGLPELDDVLGRFAPGTALVVRSSSVVEDAADSSAAGQFASVLDVTGPDGLRAAYREVLASRDRAGAGAAPIAVLVQPLVEPDRAGVAFGVDPVSGRADRRVVTAVRGRPDALVSGEVEGSRWVLDPAGGVVAADEREGADLDRATRRELVALGDRLADLFGGPQDVEWARVDGRLVVLQSRPVTSLVRGVPEGPVYGPGPVAETFPEPLAPLEEDLWVPPLREAVREALRISGTVAERDLADRDLVVTVGGRVALDLEVTGEDPEGARRRRAGLGARVRRLRSAWRIGRLRTALPLVADDLCDQVDADLDQVPPLGDLSTRQLVALVDRGREALRSLHAHEILMGLVADPEPSAFTGSSVALRVLAEARRDGWDDADIVRRAPVVLALVPPRIGPEAPLPSDASAAALAYDPPAAPDVQVRREALRLRVRWLQELVGQAALEIGRRLPRRGVLAAAGHVRQLRVDELSALVTRRATVDADTVAGRVAAAEGAEPEPLPVRFRLSDRGLAIAERATGHGGGTGAGGGVGTGPVTHDADDPPEGSVLVVGALTPGIGPQLHRLAGLVAESGSVLSHLAILAREAGVPVVVGHHGARDDLPEGAVARVDGQSGHVTLEEGP